MAKRRASVSDSMGYRRIEKTNIFLEQPRSWMRCRAAVTLLQAPDHPPFYDIDFQSEWTNSFFFFFIMDFFFINLFIYLFIYGCVGSLFLCEGFL